MTELQKYLDSNTDLEILPDNTQWKNRFEVKSESSNRVYIIAQRKSDGSWGCSCPGFKNARNGHLNRTCKHLKTILPLLEAAEKIVKQKQLN
jgi:hypothetical protein